MDPNATLALMKDAWIEGDFEVAFDCYQDLKSWFVAGGFQPNWSDYPFAEAYYNETLAKDTL